MRTTAVIIGAGHAGLAMSGRLTERSIDHVVLERGEVANSWRRERWDSLRLLTPNWQTTLPGCKYRGEDPDGYMSMADVAGFISGYATAIAAPVHPNTEVTSISAADAGYRVTTNQGVWDCSAVVIATGACNRAAIPAIADRAPDSITTHTALTYRCPQQLDEGGVLVVGASATGVQLADEIHRSGRPVTLAVGEHVRMPRTYRRRDIFWWMDRAGVLDERHDEVDDIVRARRLPSPQLVGTPHRTIDVNSLSARGVRIVGRLVGIVDGTAQFSGSLANVCRLADLKLTRLLETFDEWAAQTATDDVGPPERFDATRLDPVPTLALNLAGPGIRTIVWATGYQPDYSWLHLDVFDRRGRLVHDGGAIAGAPGLYVVGLPVLRRRRSSFISGADSDSRDIAALLHQALDEPTHLLAETQRR